MPGEEQTKLERNDKGGFDFGAQLDRKVSDDLSFSAKLAAGMVIYNKSAGPDSVETYMTEEETIGSEKFIRDVTTLSFNGTAPSDAFSNATNPLNTYTAPTVGSSFNVPDTLSAIVRTVNLSNFNRVSNGQIERDPITGEITVGFAENSATETIGVETVRLENVQQQRTVRAPRLRQEQQVSFGGTVVKKKAFNQENLTLYSSGKFAGVKNANGVDEYDGYALGVKFALAYQAHKNTQLLAQFGGQFNTIFEHIEAGRDPSFIPELGFGFQQRLLKTDKNQLSLSGMVNLQKDTNNNGLDNVTGQAALRWDF